VDAVKSLQSIQTFNPDISAWLRRMLVVCVMQVCMLLADVGGRVGVRDLQLQLVLALSTASYVVHWLACAGSVKRMKINPPIRCGVPRCRAALLLV
jgi:hypothetical protein